MVEEILRVEEKYSLNAVNVHGFYPWTCTRFLIWESLNYQRQKRKKSLFGLIKTGISVVGFVFLSLFRRSPKLHQENNVLFVCQGRRVLNDGIYENNTIDDLAEVFTDSITLEHPFKQLHHFSPAKTMNLIYSDKIMLKAHIYGQLTKYFRRKKFREIYGQMQCSLEPPLNELFGDSEADVAGWLEKMTYRYFIFKSKYKSYMCFLKNLKPNLIIEDVHYSLDNMIINELAKEVGIPTIELQHGIIGRGHIAYNYPPNEYIPQFPDMIMLFSEFWKESAEYPISNDKLIPVGFPYFERQVNKFKNVNSSESSDNVAVFLGQPNGVTKGLDELAVSTHDRIKEKGWRVVFKLHPSEFNDWQATYPLLVNTDIEVIDSHEKQLYEIFSASKALVGICSTSIFEGIGFGLAAFIYDLPGSERMDDICERKLATKVSDSESLSKHLINLDVNFETKSEELWMPNALEKMREFVTAMLATQ